MFCRLGRGFHGFGPQHHTDLANLG